MSGSARLGVGTPDARQPDGSAPMILSQLFMMHVDPQRLIANITPEKDHASQIGTVERGAFPLPPSLGMSSRSIV